MAQNSKNSSPNSKAMCTVFWGGLIAGILDGIAACSVFYLKLHLRPAQVMQYIASAIYGPEAFTGGYNMVTIGIILHFLISFALAAVYFWIYPYFKMLANWPRLSGLGFGLALWLVINLLVLPQTQIASVPFELSAALVSVIWHMILVGLPIAMITKSHFDRKLRYDV